MPAMKTAGTLRLSLITLMLALTAAAPASAAEGGKGWIGEESDAIVVAFGLGLVVFISLLVVVLSVIHTKLENRRELKKQS